MRLLLSIALLLFFPVILKAQFRETAKDQSEKKAARFANDNSSHANTYLFAEADPLGYDLLAANLSFSDKSQVQKIGFSPLRLSAKYIFLLSNFRVNVSNASGALTGGFSIGNDNSAFESKRVQTKFKDLYEPENPGGYALPIARERRADESLSQYMEYYKKSPEMKDFQDALLASFDEQRLKHVFKYSAGYNIQLFPVLKSKSAAGNFDSLNYHAVKGDNFFGKGSYSYKNGFVNLTGAYAYFHKRKSADSTQEKRNYRGYSIGFTVRVIPLIKRENLIKKDFYRNSLFIPGIYFGIIYDRQDYKGTEAIFAEDKLKWKSAITFSLDFAISPASQFRLAFPIQRSEEFNISGKNVNSVAVLQYNFKLINLNE